MNNLKKILSLALACMMLLSLLAGCGGQTSGGNEPSDSTGGEQSKGGSSTQGSEITIGVTSFADTLEPTEQYFSWVVSRYAIGETLLRFDEHGELVPCLAEEWSVSDDNLTWTFRIRQGVKFSNGEDMTPELVKASLERTFRLSDRAVGFFDPASIEVEGQDLKITTKVPSAIVPGSLADPLFLIVNTHVDDSTFAMSGPVCTGPYVVKSFSPTESCVVVRNPYYWDGEVPFDQVTLKCVDDQTTRSMALQTGEIDIAYNLKNENIAEFENNSNITIEQLESLRSTYAFMNQNGPLGDLTLRQALLAQAGYQDVDGDGYVETPAGEKLDLEFVIYTSREELGVYAQAAQASLKDIGIRVTLNTVSYETLLDMRDSGQYDLLIWNVLVANTGDPENYLRENWYSTSANNTSGYANSEVDRLLDQLASEFDSNARRDLVMQIQQEIMDDAATVFFGYETTYLFYNNRVTGVTMYPMDYYWLTKDVKLAA